MSLTNETARIIAVDDNLINDMNRFKKDLYFRYPGYSYQRVEE